MSALVRSALKFLRNTCDRLPLSRTKRVLLAASNTLTSSYLEELRQLFCDDSRLRFHFVLDPTLPVEGQMPCRSIIQCAEVPFWVANFRCWDLVVMADHVMVNLCMPERFPILRIPHGIGGKTVNGDDYYYGPKLYRKNGTLRYTCIFESSETRRARAINTDPNLEDVIRVVGDLRVDQALTKSAAWHAKRPRQRKPSVLIASSWNPGNLFDRMSAELLAEAAALLDRYTFVLRPHPNLLYSGSSSNWKELLQSQQRLGFELSVPPADVTEALLRSAVVICDDLSSVALYAGLLRKPLIIVPSGSDQISAGSFLARLQEIVPNLTEPKRLNDMLGSVLRDGVPRGVRDLAAVVNSCPGESATLIRREVFRLLNLQTD